MSNILTAILFSNKSLKLLTPKHRMMDKSVRFPIIASDLKLTFGVEEGLDGLEQSRAVIGQGDGITPKGGSGQLGQKIFPAGEGIHDNKAIAGFPKSMAVTAGADHLMVLFGKGKGLTVMDWKNGTGVEGFDNVN